MAAPAPQPVRTIGRYRVVEQIGAGGMGVVYRAHDDRLQRDVAIKVLLPGSAAGSTARHRIRKEALALSRLSHPNIATIFEFASDGDTDFLVVELIAGVALDARVAAGPLPEAETLAIGRQLLRGLAAAHEKGVIHRDLKPANLRLTADGFLKILDFGLSQFEQSEPVAAELTTESQSTAFAGTLPYMAPEQLRGAPPDTRSDLYAAGLVLFELATGRRAFDQEGAAMRIDAILNRKPPAPSEVRPELTAAFDSFVGKATEKQPALRYQSAAEMLEALENVAAPGARVPIKPFAIAGAALTVLLAAAFAIGPAYRLYEHLRFPVPEQKSIAVLPFDTLGDVDPAFARGLTDALAARLMEITSEQAQIVSPRELLSERVSTVQDAREKLGVNLVLEGQLERDGDETRVHLSLVDAKSRRGLRGENFSANASDSFSLQDAVVEKALRMLEIEIHRDLGAEGHGTTSAEAFLLFTRGMGFLERERSEENVESASAEFQQALKIDPGYPAAHAELGLALSAKYLLQRNRALLDSAARECDAALALDARSTAAYLCAGTVDLNTGRNEQAASAFETAVEHDPQFADAYGSLATAYERLRRPSDAERTYRKAIALRPRLALPYARLAGFYNRQARYKDAIVETKHATELAPGDSLNWSSLGGLYYYTGEYQQALDALQRAITIRPSFAAYTNLGDSYFALGRLPEAIAAYQQAVALMPDGVGAHGSLARAFYWDAASRPKAAGEYRKALELAGRELSTNPNDHDIQLLAAQYHAMVGEKKEALELLNSALLARPRDPETLYFAAIIHTQLGRRSEAISWLKKSLELGYSAAEIARTPEFAALESDAEYRSLTVRARQTISSPQS
jgi:tetratricopeptide (TPR) repeat protein